VLFVVGAFEWRLRAQQVFINDFARVDTERWKQLARQLLVEP